MKNDNSASTTGNFPRIKLGEKMGFLSYSGGINIVFQYRSIYHLFFLTNVLHVSMAWAGIIIAIGTIWDAINDPLIGYLAVNRKFKNGESLRPFIKWFSIPWAVTVVLIFTDFGVSPNMTIVLSLIFFLLFEIFNTTNGLPYNGLSGLATSNDSDRRSINVFRNLGAGVGSGIGAVACLPLLSLFGALDSSGNLYPDGAARGFVIVSCIMGAIIVIGGMIHYLTSKERVKQISDETEKIKPIQLLKMLLKCRSWGYNTIYILCYGVITFLLMSSVTYYATYILGSTAAATMIQAAYLVASVLTSFIVSPIDKKLGRRKSMVLAAVIAVIGKIWFIIDPFSIGAMFVNAITVGISVTFAFVLFNVNRNSIVDIVESQSGRRVDSMAATVDNLAVKLAVAGATFLSTFLLDRSGFDVHLAVQPEATIDAINIMVGWAPAIASVAMAVVAYLIPVEKELADARKKLDKLQEQKANH